MAPEYVLLFDLLLLLLLLLYSLLSSLSSLLSLLLLHAAWGIHRQVPQDPQTLLETLPVLRPLRQTSCMSPCKHTNKFQQQYSRKPEPHLEAVITVLNVLGIDVSVCLTVRGHLAGKTICTWV